MRPSYLSIVRPLAELAQAEKRIKAPVPRDFKAQPWIMGEGVTFWTPERVMALAADNEARRKRRRK